MKRKLNQNTITSLSMRFDEAENLFSGETLNAMQMAEINGQTGWWTAIRLALTSGFAELVVTELYNAVKTKLGFDDKPKTGPQPTMSFGQMMYVRIPDSTYSLEFSADSVTVDGIYNLKFKMVQGQGPVE